MGYLKEYIKLFRKLFREQFSELHYGSTTVDDETHALWFMEMARQNPNWVRALPYVEGGMVELARFERTMAKGMNDGR